MQPTAWGTEVLCNPEDTAPSAASLSTPPRCACPPSPGRRFRERIEPIKEHLSEAASRVIEEELEKLQVDRGCPAGPPAISDRGRSAISDRAAHAVDHAAPAACATLAIPRCATSYVCAWAQHPHAVSLNRRSSPQLLLTRPHQPPPAP